MCGIVGIWHSDGKQVSSVAMWQATKALRHRGPDDEGYLFVNTATACYEERGGETRVGPGVALTEPFERPDAATTDESEQGGIVHHMLWWQ